MYKNFFDLDLYLLYSTTAEKRIDELKNLYKNKFIQLKIIEEIIKNFRDREYNEKTLEMARQKIRHILLVPIVARHIAKAENINDPELLLMIDIAALLHDWGRVYDVIDGSFKNLSHFVAGEIDLFENKRFYSFSLGTSEKISCVTKFTVFMHGAKSLKTETAKYKEYAEIAKKYPEAYTVCEIVQNADRWANNIDFLKEDYRVILGVKSLKDIWKDGVDELTKYELIHGTPITRNAGVPYTNLRHLASHIGWAFCDNNLKCYIEWLYKTRWPEKYVLAHIPSGLDISGIDGDEENISDFMDIVSDVMEQLKYKLESMG